MVKSFYRHRDDAILGLCTYIVTIANQRAEQFLDRAGSNKNNHWDFFTEYLSIIMQTVIRRAEQTLAKEEAQYLLDSIGLLVTWLAVEATVFYLELKEKLALLEETRRLCSDKIDYYRKLQGEDSKDMGERPSWNCAKRMAMLEGSSSNLGAILGQQLMIATTLKSINVGQFLENYQSCGPS